MYYQAGDIIDSKYRVDGTCSTAGGMGAVLFVTAISGGAQGKLVLKYCKIADEDCTRRFRRETRLLSEFSGNTKVVEILDHNLSHAPPYYVMPHYADGDLTSLHYELARNLPLQEKVFCQMIDCIAVLHAKGTFHRDIKPQNFLRDGAGIRVSDLGLSMQVDSATAFTRSSESWRTEGYDPPEFRDGGFKHVDAMSDIFMLGKSFYALLTRRDPTYLRAEGIPAPLFHLIEKCCQVEKRRRYQNLDELKRAVVAVYDSLLGRSSGPVSAKQLLASITVQLNKGRLESAEIREFLDAFAHLNESGRVAIAKEIPQPFFKILATPEFADQVREFLNAYGTMVASHDYGWSFAETVAANMQILFRSDVVRDRDKADALRLAVEAARAMNRFAAMETCQEMVTSVSSDGLAFQTREVLKEFPESFLYSIEPLDCHHETVAAAIREIKQEAEDRK